ncbi:uncharacterized protein PRCAT00004219001 [Priceomyces carsonii]|uniref:uncharacterized protein n=1 Tax=Priceomyces carsonii TaxID=28549 RepID=UPI002ED8F547|nr:unnamed protein product [Priceomyces carsonii]
MSLSNLNHNSIASASAKSSTIDLGVHDASYSKGPLTVPFIREQKYGQCIGARASLLEELITESTIGPPNLVHWGKYYGMRSNHYLHNEFVVERASREDKRDDEGYVGYYHYVNGLKYESFERDIENYILGALGIEKENGDYYFKKNPTNESFASSRKEMIVTFCSYNLFDKSDFRVRYVINLSGSTKKVAAHIDMSYQIVYFSSGTYDRNRKNASYNADSVSKIPRSYWEELKASEIIRLFIQLDDPSRLLTALVSLPGITETRNTILNAIITLVNLLPRGTRAGTRPSFGSSVASGTKNDSKSTDYRNYLVDSLLRLCYLDPNGDIGNFAIDAIKNKYYQKEDAKQWDYVIVLIMKIQAGINREQDFLNLIHKHLKSNIYTTQLSLLLSEQVKYLISKSSYDKALLVAKKCVQILSLDFDSWYYLALCYVLVGDYRKALLVMNHIPVVLSHKQKNNDIDTISGITDWYSRTFSHRLNLPDETINENLLNSFFPPPRVNSKIYQRYRTSPAPPVEVEMGSITKMWHDMLLFNQNLRHPINGYHFYQSPLINCSGKELSSVDPMLIRICGPSSAKNLLASHSAGTPSTSILDINYKSTWGRCYDLLSLIIAQVGWDELVRIKESSFSGKESNSSSNQAYVVNNDSSSLQTASCDPWLDQLFLILYEDLRVIMTIRSRENQQHSALEWEMLGLLGWNVKYGIKESIGSLITSVMGKSMEGLFDYFGTVQLLEIYDEFVLSDVSGSHLDVYHDVYDNKFYATKLALQLTGQAYTEFVSSLENDFLTLDFMLLQLIKLVSWNLRWYQYATNYLVMKILTKLIFKHDSIFIRSQLKMIVEQNKAANTKKSLYSFSTLFGYTTQKKQVEKFEFLEKDTILDYLEEMLTWIENIKDSNP